MNLYLVVVYYAKKGCFTHQLEARNQIAPDERSAVNKVIEGMNAEYGVRNIRIDAHTVNEVSFESLQATYKQLAKERGIRV